MPPSLPKTNKPGSEIDADPLESHSDKPAFQKHLKTTPWMFIFMSFVSSNCVFGSLTASSTNIEGRKVPERSV